MLHWVRVILEEAVDARENHPEYVRNGLKRIVQIVEQSELISFRTCEFEEIADAVSVCDCLTELSRLMWQSATSSGFQHFSLSVVNQGQSAAPKSRMLTSFHEKWIARYQEKSYHFVDPVAERARHADDSFHFSELDHHVPLVQEFWADADRHRVGTHGFCYVTSRPDGARFSVTFFSGLSKAKFEEMLRLNRSDLEAISQLAVECFCHLTGGTIMDENVLSENELKFLHRLATGNNPAQAFEQTARFGGNSALQATIRQKLGVETIFQAIAIVSARRWFDSLPIDDSEIITPFPKLLGC